MILTDAALVCWWRLVRYRGIDLVWYTRSNTMLPNVPAASEAPMVPIFDMSSETPPPNARVAMNNDIVKPIPASQAAPNRPVHESSGGGVASRIFAEAQAKPHIPTGLPMNSPRVTPKLTRCVAAAKLLPKTRTPAFANANSGLARDLGVAAEQLLRSLRRTWHCQRRQPRRHRSG